MAYLYETAKSPYWIARYKSGYRPDGKARYTTKSTGFEKKASNRSKAQKFADQCESACLRINAGEVTAKNALDVVSRMVQEVTGEHVKAPILSQYCTNWLENKKARKVSENTYKKYDSVIRGFLPSMGKKQDALMSAITNSDIERWYLGFLKEGNTVSTANLHFKIIKSVFKSGLKGKDNPCEDEIKQEEDSEERVPFTPKELKKLLKASEGDWNGVLLIAIYTGMRLGDIAKLEWQSYDRRNKTLSFKASKTFRRKKGKKAITTIALHPQIITWLNKQGASIGSKPIFETLYKCSSGSNQGLSNQFDKLMKKAGVARVMGEKKQGSGRQLNLKSFHALRHTFTSLLANKGVPSEVRKEFVGHTSDEIHSRYTHLTLETQRKALAKIQLG